jgi:predicted metal-dependent HD superfamily phosphohydrolase
MIRIILERSVMFERSGRAADSATPSTGSVEETLRFLALWTRCLGSDPPSARRIYAGLAELYGESHRHYHTLNHIRHCLAEFDRAAALMDHPDAIEMALWFHDAIYQPGASDNEWRSAELFRQWSNGRGPPAFQRRVHELIMATTHQESPHDQDARFMVDIDLSSFGLPWEQCAQDGRLIRAEFADLHDDEYYPGHLQFLRVLQSRPTFFFTEWFRQRYETVACGHVARIITELQARGYD